MNELYLAGIELELALEEKAGTKEENKGKPRSREKILEWARGHVDGRKGQVLALAGYIELLWLAGDREKAAAEFDVLRGLSGKIDLQTPVFQRLAPIARELGHKGDWRRKYEQPSDVGVRPDLGALGPFRWQAPKAAPWKLKNH